MPSSWRESPDTSLSGLVPRRRPPPRRSPISPESGPDRPCRDPGQLPLNARGIALREAIDESLAPMYDCVPATVPHILGDPYNFQIEQRPDRVIIKFEKDAVTRTVWSRATGTLPLRTTTLRSTATRSAGTRRGSSWWRPRKYTFDPGGLEDKPPMTPTSTQKKTVERYSKDGDKLTVDVVLEDRLIIKEPVRVQVRVPPDQGGAGGMARVRR